MLGRCRRRVLVCDAGASRNRWSHAVHGYLTRDGTPPADLLRLAREELRAYDTVELRSAEVVDAARDAEGFDLRCADGSRLRSHKLLLATGVVDELPLQVADRFVGRLVDSPYFHNYARQLVSWRLAVGEIDGELAVVIQRAAIDGWAPKAAARLHVRNGRIAAITDYSHCPWVLQSATSIIIEHSS